MFEDDLKKLERDILRMGKFPTTLLTKSVKSGGRMLLSAVKQNAPSYKGILKQALIMKLEKSKKKGKRVVYVGYDSAFTDRLAKTSKDGRRSFYPASQEYGWTTKSGKRITPKKIHFMRNTLDSKADEFTKIVTEEMIGAIERVWRK
jgi:hypothetical protein